MVQQEFSNKQNYLKGDQFLENRLKECEKGKSATKFWFEN